MKVRVLNIILSMVVVFGLVFLTGCGTLETLINKDGSPTSIGGIIGGNANNGVSEIPAAANSPETSIEGKRVALYFADSSGKYLVKEDRVLPKTVSLARETVNQWLKGPAEKGTSELAEVSPTTKLLDINIKDNVATVDLSQEFLQPKDKVSPEVVLYGLVNTLTQFSTIKEVQIRIEGKPLTKYGTLDAAHLVNKPSLVKVSSSAGTTLPATAGNANTNANPNPNTNNTNNTNPTDSSTPKPSPSSINLFDYPTSST